MNLYFSKEEKELTERVEVKNKPVIDETCDNLETENKLLLHSASLEERKTLFVI